MSTTIGGARDQLIFQINNSDVGPLFTDTLRLQCNGLSPFGESLRTYAPGSGAPSAGLAEIARHPRLQEVAAILSQPDLRITHRTGGGSLDVSFFGAFRSRSVRQEAIATLTPSFEGSWMVQLFDTPREYLAWWLGLVASRVEEPAANYMPPPLPLESLVYLLHAVDSFRRVSYASMLSYTPAVEPFVTSAEFSETLTRALSSQDMRWLLPAFLYLTPGLNQFTFEPSPEHLDILEEHDFLLPVQHPQTREDVFVFGEAGRTLGVEFYRTWMMAVGFDTTVLTPQGEKSVNRGFLAPTALANHLIRLEPDGTGGCTANHQALTLAELEFRLRDMLDPALAAEGANGVTPGLAWSGDVGRPAALSGSPPPQAPQVVPGPPTAAPSGAIGAFCPNCGIPRTPGARFCRACGAPLT